MVLKNTVVCWRLLPAKPVQSAARLLEGENNVKGGDGLPPAMLGVRDSIADQVLQEKLQNRAGLLIDGSGNALHTPAAGQTTDCRLCGIQCAGIEMKPTGKVSPISITVQWKYLGNAVDLVAEHLPVALGPSLSKSLAAFAASAHDLFFDVRQPPQMGNRVTVSSCKIQAVRFWVLRRCRSFSVHLLLSE